MPCDCCWSVTLLQGATHRSAVCNCGISWSYSLAFDQFFLNKRKNNLRTKYQAKIVVIICQFLSFNLIIAHDLKPTRKCANLLVISSRDKILQDIFG